VGIAAAPGRRTLPVSKLARVATLAAALACGVALPTQVLAQATGSDAQIEGQLLLESDRLIYNNDADTVTAAGNVRINYDGRRIVAQRVIYDRKSARLMAYGNVEVIERDGTRTFAEEIDISDDFRDGFVNALQVETTEETYFAAESAVRRGGERTTFNNGIYTACKPCEENPDRPPIWRVKSSTIIWNSKKKTIRFVSPRMELFGLPIAYFPSLTVPDHTVKRKSGFLFPTLRTSSRTGVGLTVPYYHVFSPSMDLTVQVTGYTRQGFLGEAEFRKAYNNGQFSIKVAGISQANPLNFPTSEPVSRSVRTRFMVGTKGRFQINPRWAFGWNILAQTDKNFANTYTIDGYADYYHKSEIYLTGLNKRNYFDLRFMRFQVQESALDSVGGVLNPSARNPIQPWVLPSLDYSYTPDAPLAGGELNIDLNVQGLHRANLAERMAAPDPVFGTDTNIDGIEGSSGRVTLEAEWKRSLIAPGGAVITPLLHARGDAIMANYSAATIAAINAKQFNGAPAPVDIHSSYYRTMATAGLEARWPIMMATQNTSHVIEPVAQIFARPDEPYGTTLGIPNEDAQSLVFDATNLFERDKFSGYDRIEGGVRANLGFRYTGQFGERWYAGAIVGQSYHLAGQNPYASPDLVNVGAYSGLETARSDYVGQVSFGRPGINFMTGARLDETTLELRRLDAAANATVGRVSASARYAYIQAQPLYGFAYDRKEVTLAASAQVAEYWRVFGSGTYDFESRALVRNGIGFTYDDECFTFTFTAAQSRTVTRGVSGPVVSKPNTSFGIRVSLRTLGDFGTTTGSF